MSDSTNQTGFTPHSHLPYGADGSGHYTKAAQTAFGVIKEATALTLKAIDEVSLRSEDGAFAICDYGSADGGTSMLIIRDIIDKVQENYGVEQQVHVIYEDQPVNDFKSLLLRMHGFIPDPPSYLIDHNNVFVSCCGTNFYSQCLPDNSVHFGFSANVLHWLSKRPCNISGGHLSHLLTGDKEENGLYVEQGARDWETFLLHRAKELKPGGQMIILCPALDEAGQYSGATKNSPHNMYESLEYHWRSMLQDGHITQKEFDNASFNCYMRRNEEYSAPFRDRQSDVCRAGLRFVSIEVKVTQCFYHHLLLREENQGDGVSAQKFAHSAIRPVRAWVNHTFFSALSEDRPEEERRALLDEFFQRYENEIAKNPRDFACDYVSAYMHIAKQNCNSSTAGYN